MLNFGGVLYHDMIHDMIITLQFGLDSTWIPENEKECYIGVPPPGPRAPRAPAVWCHQAGEVFQAGRPSLGKYI